MAHVRATGICAMAHGTVFSKELSATRRRDTFVKAWFVKAWSAPSDGNRSPEYDRYWMSHLVGPSTLGWWAIADPTWHIDAVEEQLHVR
jgi:hypothetical protein